MLKLKCQECGAILHWNGIDKIVKCEFCGSEYVMNPQNTQNSNIQKIKISQGDAVGMCPIESYVPDGWQAYASQAPIDFYGDHLSNPYVPQVIYNSPDGSYIIYRGTNIYTDKKLSRVPLMHGIDVLGTYMRVGTPFSAEQYCDYLFARDINAIRHKKYKIENADEKELERQNTIAQNYYQNGFNQITSDWKRIYYLAIDSNQQEKVISIETRINDTRKQGQGIFGKLVNNEHYWETQYEFIVVANKNNVNKIMGEAQKINLSINPTEDLEKIKQALIQHIQQLINQTNMVIQQQNMESWDRRSKIIQDTHNHAMNVMHEMNANTSMTHQRVANLQSEAIRGVNTYMSPERIVEANVKYDHMYQSTQDSDVYVASDGWLKPNVDFVEIKKTNGNH